MRVLQAKLVQAHIAHTSSPFAAHLRWLVLLAAPQSQQAAAACVPCRQALQALLGLLLTQERWWAWWWA